MTRRTAKPRAAGESSVSSRDGRSPDSLPRAGRARNARSPRTCMNACVQNVHAMRPEVRAEYERAPRPRLDGDAAFRVRLERFFTELRDPLVALYGARRALPGAVARAARRDRRGRRGAGARAARASTTSARSRPTGCSASRRSATSPTSTASPGRSPASASGCRYLRELGVTYLHLMPLLRARPEPNDGGYAVADYGAVEPRAGDDGRPARARRPSCAPPGWRCASTSCSTTPRASTRGRRPRSRATRPMPRLLPDVPRPHASRTPTSARCPRSSPTSRPATSPGSTELGRWVWTTFNAVPVGPRLHEPEVFVRDGRGDARPRRPPASTCCASTRCRSCGSGSARTARTSPRSTSCCRRFRAVVRIAAPAVAFKAEAIVSPRDLVAYLGAGRHEGKECDLAYHNVAHGPAAGARWPRAASALMTQHAAGDAARAAPARAGSTYVRCHDDIGWAITEEDAARGRRGRARCTAASSPTSTPATSRARSPAARASSPTRSRARRARAARPRRSPGSRRRSSGRRGRGRARDPPRSSCCYAIAFAHGGLPLDLHGRRARPAQRPGWADDPAHARRQPLDAPPVRWTGRQPSAATIRRRVEGRLWAGLRRLVEARRGDAARSTPQGAREPVLDRATSTSSGSGGRAATSRRSRRARG